MCTHAHRRSCECACYTGEHMCLWTHRRADVYGNLEIRMHVQLHVRAYVLWMQLCMPHMHTSAHKVHCEPQAFAKTQPMHITVHSLCSVEWNLFTSPWSHRCWKLMRLYKQDPSLYSYSWTFQEDVSWWKQPMLHRLWSNNKKSDHQSSTSKKRAQNKPRQALCHPLKTSTATRTTKWLYLAAIIKHLGLFFQYEIVPPHIPVSTLRGMEAEGIIWVRTLGYPTSKSSDISVPSG